MTEKTQFDPKELRETKRAPERPSRLYRAYTINPEDLNLEKLGETLVPGSQAIDDPTRIGDGNERGVYMSTNETMVEIVYACGRRAEGSFIKTEPYIDKHGSHSLGVELPVCGIVIEVETEALAIREPKMIPALEGHYNNGFAGYEWIADQIDPQHYKVIKLILSLHSNDPRKRTVELNNLSEEDRVQAIELIKQIYTEAKNVALQFKAFLESLEPKQRMNGYVLQKKWQQYKQEQGIPDTSHLWI